MFVNTIWLILVSCFLQMLNDKILKANETCLKCKYQLKDITITLEKRLQPIKNTF